MSNSQNDIANNEIDILELCKVIWVGKKRVALITLVFASISLIYALSQPNIYQTDALLAPAGDENSSQVSNLASQFGGFASLAGISISEEGVKKSDLGLEVLKSRKFVREFFDRHKLTPQLMAVDYWDKEGRRLILDNNIYDEKSKAWLGGDGPPTNDEVYQIYLDNLVINDDIGSEFVRIGFKHKSPDVAAKLTNLIIKDLNNAIRKQDIEEAESSIAYLRQQVEASPLSDLRKLFYNLIQSQTETMMLANVREEYVFKTIDPAIVPEQKSEPNRTFIFILGTALGGFLALMYVIIRHYVRPINSQTN